MPVYIFIILGIKFYFIRKDDEIPEEKNYYPRVSCIVTCYSEGKDVALTIRSLTEQIYPGVIEIISVVDGAVQNKETYEVAKQLETYVGRFTNLILKVVPKWQRGGRVSSLNTGLNMASGEVVMALDGDTSFDNNMVRDACLHFADSNVVGVAGSLRVRNVFQNLVTRLQGLEYLLSIHASKVGLSIHYRYLHPDKNDLCLGCALENLDLEEVTLMIYVSNPIRVAQLADPIAKRYPRVKFSIAQSVESILTKKESYFTKT